MKAVVVIATVGRVSACERALAAIDGRIHDASVEVRGVVSAPTEADLPRVSGAAWQVITGSRDASAQRNAALDLVPADTDVVFFFDDDTIPRADYIACTCEFFASNPGVVATTGTLLADGAGERREVPLEEAMALLDLSWETTPADSPTTGVEHFELYGCNAAVRWTAARGFVARVMLRPMAMNVILAPIPGQRYAMRRQRLIGNCLALWDVIRDGGHATPERILDLR